MKDRYPFQGKKVKGKKMRNPAEVEEMSLQDVMEVAAEFQSSAAVVFVVA